MKIVLAGEEYDQALRQLARDTPVPGWVRLAFCREPAFFHGLTIEGDPAQVVAAVEGGSLVGMGCRAIRSVHVNGQRSLIGYLSGLKILPSARRATILGRGYRFLRTLHYKDRLVPAYLTTVVEGNRTAMSLLTSKRAGLPQYLDHGQFITYAIDTGLSSKPPAPQGLTIRRGGQVVLDDIIHFLNREGSRRQFFPVLETGEFGTDRLRGLQADDFLVASAEGSIVGVLAGWNQSGFKQYVVQGYNPVLLIARPILNCLLRALKAHPLPKVGQRLDVVYASFVCVRDDNPEVLSLLLETLCQNAKQSGAQYVLVGLHERDPLNKALTSFRALKYRSRLYVACWDDGLGFVKSLDTAQVPYLELATL